MSGKTSLLHAICGEMAYVSDEYIEAKGGLEAEFVGTQLFEMHREVVRAKIDKPPIIKRGSTAYVEQSSWI